MRKDRSKSPGRKRYGNPAFRANSSVEDRDRFAKIVGVILVSTMAIGVFSSMWFGWKIRAGLSDLDHEKVVSREHEERMTLLEARRTQLMNRDLIEKKASVLGLRKPGPAQIIRP